MRHSTLVVVATAAAAATAGCAPGTNAARDVAQSRSTVLGSVAPTGAVEIPEECRRSDPAPDLTRSLDTWFDVDRAAEAIAGRIGSSEGSLLLEITGAGPDDPLRTGVITDLRSEAQVRSTIGVFMNTRRPVELPDGQTLRVVLIDDGEVALDLVEAYRTCPAVIEGGFSVATVDRMLATARQLEGELGVEHALALQLDPWGRPAALIFAGEAEPGAIRASEAAQVLASARFRPAFVEGVQVAARVALADAEVDAAAVRAVDISGIDAALWTAARSETAERVRPLHTVAVYRARGDNLVPCGFGASQFAEMCTYGPNRGYGPAPQQDPFAGWAAYRQHLERSSERGRVSFQIDQCRYTRVCNRTGPGATTPKPAGGGGGD